MPPQRKRRAHGPGLARAFSGHDPRRLHEASPEVMSTRSPSTSDILDMIAEAKRDCLRNVEARRKKEGTNPDPQPFVRDMSTYHRKRSELPSMAFGLPPRLIKDLFPYCDLDDESPKGTPGSNSVPIDPGVMSPKFTPVLEAKVAGSELNEFTPVLEAKVAGAELNEWPAKACK